MTDYDGYLSAARRSSMTYMDKAAENLTQDTFRTYVNSVGEEMKAWDQLTDALVRQRKERDEQISRLLNELAEAKRPCRRCV